MSHDAYGSCGFADCALTLSALSFGLCTRKECCLRGLIVSYGRALTLHLSGSSTAHARTCVRVRVRVCVCICQDGEGRAEVKMIWGS